MIGFWQDVKRKYSESQNVLPNDFRPISPETIFRENTIDAHFAIYYNRGAQPQGAVILGIYKTKVICMTSPSINAAVPTQAAAGKTNKAAAMVDARFFLTSDLEAAIAQLPGVRGVRIVAPEAEIEEIHIMASTEVRPKTIVRNVCTLLLVRFGVRLDHRRISIVQADAQPDHQLARPVIYDVRHTHEDDGAVVSVELRCSGQRTYGKCRIDENTSAICAGGLALIEAVENLIARHGELDLREARLVTLQEHELVLVLVSWHGALAEELFVGAAFTTGDRASASARATLDAINRKLVRLPLALVG